MFTVAREYRDAILLALKPNKKLIGIKVFEELYYSDEDGNVLEHLEDYVDRCIQSAIELKGLIEDGTLFHFNEHPKILLNPPTGVDIDYIIQMRSTKIQQLNTLKLENRFIELERTMMIQLKKKDLDLTSIKICLDEMAAKCNLTPLMLKKNSHIVQWVAKLCRFTERDLQSGRLLTQKSIIIRKYARNALDSFKRVMKYNAVKSSDKQFMKWFFNSVQLLDSLCQNMTDIERRQLTIDPEIEFFKQRI